MNIKLQPQASAVLTASQAPIVLKVDTKHQYTITLLSPWRDSFQGKIKTLTRKWYIYDSQLFSERDPQSRARKLLGEDEILTLGAIRNPVYFGPLTDVEQVPPEFAQVSLHHHAVTITNVSLRALTIKTAPKQ